MFLYILNGGGGVRRVPEETGRENDHVYVKRHEVTING